MKLCIETDVNKFIENRGINAVLIKRDNSALDNIVTKVSVTNRFDVYYQGYSDIDISSSKLRILGLYDNVEKIIYSICSYDVKQFFPEIKQIQITDVLLQRTKDLNDAYNDYIYNHAEEFKKQGKEVIEQYISCSTDLEIIKNSAINYFINNENPDEVKFKYEEETYFGIIRLNTILPYLVDKASYIRDCIQNKIYTTDKTTIGSSKCGVADIEVTQEQLIGFYLLKLDLIKKYIKELSEDKNTIYAKKKAIRSALDCDKMKTVNVTVVNNGEELTFKYPTNTLSRFYISEYNIPDTKVRAKYKQLFSDKYYYDDMIVSRIVKITYSKKVIYEGEDISSVVD